MPKLVTTPNIDRPDDFYAALLSLHEGRGKEESDAVNARLILLLANHIGEMDVLRDALDAAGNVDQADAGSV